MRTPPRLLPLFHCGVIDRVVRPLQSGKEAQVYLVECDGHLRAAKVYKGSTERSFRNRSGYTEGRTVRNSRDQRAMAKRSRHGRSRDEDHWKAAEVETIYKLDAAGVRVPKPYAYIEGVLVMECIVGTDGSPAPRLGECALEPERARAVLDQLIGEVVKMLCADVVHGDLSAYNVLMEEAGPVIIDFPQAIDAARNRNARSILLRDVANLTSHLKHGRPARELRFGHEMWGFYERGELLPDTPLTGQVELANHKVDTDLLLQQMIEIDEDAVLAKGDGDFDLGGANIVAGLRHRQQSPRKSANGAANGAANGRRRRPKKATSGPEVVVKGQPTKHNGAPTKKRTNSPATDSRATDSRATDSRATDSRATDSPATNGEGTPKRRRRRRRRRPSTNGNSNGANAANGSNAAKTAAGSPAASRPAAKGPAPSRPAASRPAASRPAASRPAASRSAANSDGPPRRRRRRRRRSGSGGGGANASAGGGGGGGKRES